MQVINLRRVNGKQNLKKIKQERTYRVKAQNNKQVNQCANLLPDKNPQLILDPFAQLNICWDQYELVIRMVKIYKLLEIAIVDSIRLE